MGVAEDEVEAVVFDDEEEPEFDAAAVELDPDEDFKPADPYVPEEEEAIEIEISTDSLQLFLKDIGKVNLLTAAQEVELAKRIERGDHEIGRAHV